MYSHVRIEQAGAGETFDRDFIGRGEVIVRREGYSRARHVFTLEGRPIGRLSWKGLRRAVYECENEQFEVNVTALDRKIALISQDGGESSLVERSSANPNRAGLRIEMAEGDDFRIVRRLKSPLRGEEQLVVNKRFYQSTLLVFRFEAGTRSQTTVRVTVKPVMRWEAKFIHRLLALVVCRIILERRHQGSKPRKLKEISRRRPAQGRSRQRKRVTG